MMPRFGAVAAIVSLSVLDGAAQPPAFSTRIEAVRVDALVTDRGQPIRGLGAADFEILDNGVLQQVNLLSFEQIPLNIVLALDMSDSVAGERLDHLRSAGRAAVASLEQGDQAALITFSHVVALGAPLSGDTVGLLRALDDTAGSGETSLVDGVFAGMMVGESDAGRALLIVFSDGVDTSSWLSGEVVLDSAKRSDIVAYAVSVQSRMKPEFLRDLTSFTGGRLLEIEKTSDLASTFRAIVDEFRHRYLVSYTPRGVTKEGWHRLDVRVKRGGATVKARPGYLGGP
jgi:VWFA-related protein